MQYRASSCLWRKSPNLLCSKLLHALQLHPCHIPHTLLISLRRDAQEAARRRDGYEFGGSRLRVEVAKGGNETQSAPRAAYRAPRGAAGYRILIKGLPKSASWQDLKVGGRSHNVYDVLASILSLPKPV